MQLLIIACSVLRSKPDRRQQRSVAGSQGGRDIPEALVHPSTVVTLSVFRRLAAVDLRQNVSPELQHSRCVPHMVCVDNLQAQSGLACRTITTAAVTGGRRPSFPCGDATRFTAAIVRQGRCPLVSCDAATRE